MDVNYYYKISFSVLIVSNAIYQFIKDEQNISYFEKFLKFITKDARKELIFKEFIKSKISYSKIEFVKNLKIKKTIELWSLFSKANYPEILNLLKGKLEKGKVYFIDIRD